MTAERAWHATVRVALIRSRSAVTLSTQGFIPHTILTECLCYQHAIIHVYIINMPKLSLIRFNKKRLKQKIVYSIECETWLDVDKPRYSNIMHMLPTYIEVVTARHSVQDVMMG